MLNSKKAHVYHKSYDLMNVGHGTTSSRCSRHSTPYKVAGMPHADLYGRRGVDNNKTSQVFCDSCLLKIWSSNCHMTYTVGIGRCKSSIKLGNGSAKTARIHLSRPRQVRIIHFQSGELLEFASKIDSLVSSVICQSGSYPGIQRKCKCHWFSVGIPVALLVKTYRNVFKRDLHSLGTRHCRMKYKILTCWRYGVPT